MGSGKNEEQEAQEAVKESAQASVASPHPQPRVAAHRRIAAVRDADVEAVTVIARRWLAAVAAMAAHSGEAAECMPGPTAAVSEPGVQRTSDARLWQRPGGRRLAQSISLSVVSQSPTRVAVCANRVQLRVTTSSITNYDTLF